MTATFIEPVLERLVPVSPQEHDRLLRLLLPRSGLRPLRVDLSCFALMPAICEEVLFRGVLLPALGGPLAAALPRPLAGAPEPSPLFGAFHLSPARLLPTAVLGLGFGGAVVLTGSLWPAVGMHLVNNALVILLTRAGSEGPPQPWEGHAGALWLACAAVATAAWLLLLVGPRFRAPQSFGADGKPRKRNVKRPDSRPRGTARSIVPHMPPREAKPQDEKRALWYLKKIPLFQDLTHDTLVRLAECVELNEVRRRQVIYLPGRSRRRRSTSSTAAASRSPRSRATARS